MYIYIDTERAERLREFFDVRALYRCVQGFDWLKLAGRTIPYLISWEVKLSWWGNISPPIPSESALELVRAADLKFFRMLGILFPCSTC